MHVGFGSDLQKQRVKRGVELEAIAATTRVSLRHLRALEDERSADLPGGVFNRGLLRNYCEVVGLEQGEWMERFATSELNTTADPDWVAFAESVRKNRASRTSSFPHKWLGVLLMVIGLAALGWAAWHFSVKPRLTAEPRLPPVSASSLSAFWSPGAHDSV
jgi:cytoskeletal protein RodZ